MAYENIIVETKGRVGLITLNRPNALNALNNALIADLNVALEGFEADDGIGCIVITGSEKAFAAGADIKEMQPKSYMDVYKANFISTGSASRLPQADHRRGHGVRARRRGGARHELRLHHRRRHREVRPARDQARHHAGRRRHAAAGDASSASRRRWRCASRGA